MKKKFSLALLTFVFVLSTGIIETEILSASNQQGMHSAIRWLRSARRRRLKTTKLAALNHAYSALLRARRNKGGHRAAAMRIIRNAKRIVRRGRMIRANNLISRAINRVRMGIRFANRRK